MDQLLYLKTTHQDYIYDSRRNIILKAEAITDTNIEQNRQIVHPKSKILNKLLHNDMKNLILQVTMNCNLECVYCIYSELYNNRLKDNSNMSETIAKKSIDFFVENSSNTEELKIGFYGGEPLLAFSVVKKAVLYILERTNKKIHFTLTTNLTLITKEMADFFQLHNFTIIVSLDGDKLQNDKYRIDRVGNGTYDIVEKNLFFLRNKYPDLYRNIIFNSVVTNISDKQKSLNFFRKKKDFWCEEKPLPHKVYYIRSGYDKEKFTDHNGNINPRYDYILKKNMMRQLILKFLTIIYYIQYKIFNISEPSKYFELYQSNEKIITLLSKSIKCGFLPSENEGFCDNVSIHHHGPCVPGQNRLLVTTNGLFYPCEKVSEKCKDCIIGDIDNGFDEKKIYNLLNLGQYTEKNCKSCWAIHLCTFCVVNCGDKEKICIDDVNNECISRKEALKKELEFSINVINLIRKNNEY